MDPLALIEDYLSDQENGMKNLITGFLNQVMLAEALQQAGAAQYKRTDARKAHRNGYKERSLKTRYGGTTLRKPQFREFPFETQVFGRYARVEKALVNAVVESYLQGVSTRRVQEIVVHLGIDQLSPASVSRMARGLDDQVQAFLLRPIEQPTPSSSWMPLTIHTVLTNYADLSQGGIQLTPALKVNFTRRSEIREGGEILVMSSLLSSLLSTLARSDSVEGYREEGIQGSTLPYASPARA